MAQPKRLCELSRAEKLAIGKSPNTRVYKNAAVKKITSRTRIYTRTERDKFAQKHPIPRSPAQISAQKSAVKGFKRWFARVRAIVSNVIRAPFGGRPPSYDYAKAKANLLNDRIKQANKFPRRHPLRIQIIDSLFDDFDESLWSWLREQLGSDENPTAAAA